MGKFELEATDQRFQDRSDSCPPGRILLSERAKSACECPYAALGRWLSSRKSKGALKKRRLKSRVNFVVRLIGGSSAPTCVSNYSNNVPELF